MKIHWMVGGRPGEEGLLQREGCGESHVFTSSEWAAWLRASEIRNFKTDKTGLEDGPGPHPHVSLRIQTLRSTETPSWHFSTLWPALGATPAPSAWVSAWGQAQLRWPPSYESFQKLLTWRDWAPPQQNTCTACDAQGGPPGSPSFCGPISPGWQVKKPAPSPHPQQLLFEFFLCVSVISLTSNIYRDALMSEKKTDEACWRCHGEGP